MISIGLILMTVIIYSGSLNLTDVVIHQEKIWYTIPFLPLSVMMFISLLAETNRSPFDLPEAEAELVAGYNVEYSSMGFALFFLGEYINIILMSFLITLLFFGGWIGIFYFIPNIIWLSLKLSFFLYLFVAIRATYPRYRYDQLMKLGWKVLLPLSLGFVWLYSGIFIGFYGYSTINNNLFYIL